jgi:hypothetical protein
LNSQFRCWSLKDSICSEVDQLLAPPTSCCWLLGIDNLYRTLARECISQLLSLRLLLVLLLDRCRLPSRADEASLNRQARAHSSNRSVMPPLNRGQPLQEMTGLGHATPWKLDLITASRLCGRSTEHMCCLAYPVRAARILRAHPRCSDCKGRSDPCDPTLCLAALVR